MVRRAAMAPDATANEVALPAWTSPSDGVQVLDVGFVVLTVIQRAKEEYIVQSSHGAPDGVYPTEESACKYAQRFLCAIMERTLAGLSDLEMSPNAARWRSRQGELYLTCGVLVVRVPLPDLPEPEAGDVKAQASNLAALEQAKRQAILDGRTQLRALVAQFGT